jgi:hypothetical protein
MTIDEFLEAYCAHDNLEVEAKPWGHMLYGKEGWGMALAPVKHGFHLYLGVASDFNPHDSAAEPQYRAKNLDELWNMICLEE